MTDLADAAFGDRPDLVITRTPTDPREQWLAAVVLGGQGRYAAAVTVLDGLRDHPDPVLAALACATLASHRRQLGGHAAARVLDAMGHARLAGLPDAPAAAEARSDVLLGLAADAVGVARLGEARRLVATARARGAGWRSAIRVDWVSAEIELSSARADDAVPYAERAAARAGQEGSVRHRIKSAMVLGAALVARGRTGRAARTVRAALADAIDLGLLSLVWPGALIMAELDATRAEEFRRCAGLALQSVLHRTDPIGRRLAERSPWVPRPAGPTG